ncbi:VOC family protein [Streptomyces sp. SBC-4]|nr:VOC family protein [Streptomyces sp. SBC-4]MDV5149872.1 VOC family protein [Streptomyces sp. SBC-4]
MFGETSAFSGFSVDDLDAARRFYGETLGLKVEEQGEGEMRMLFLTLAGGTRIFVYPKENHTPASYTILNFEVDDIERAVDELTGRGITLERYPGFEADEKGIVRDDDGGLAIAWFTDPAGNVLSVLRGHP